MMKMTPRVRFKCAVSRRTRGIAALAIALAIAPGLAAGQTRVATVEVLQDGDFHESESVILAGYNQAGDGGGGLLSQADDLEACEPNGGTMFEDDEGTCFIRVAQTGNVREWGAYCDVTVVGSGVLWNGTTSRLLIPKDQVKTAPAAGQFIAISQIGGPTLWMRETATEDAAPARSATR